MENINFGFKGLSPEGEDVSENVRNIKPQNLRSFFGQKSFETSWQFIETLA